MWRRAEGLTCQAAEYCVRTVPYNHRGAQPSTVDIFEGPCGTDNSCEQGECRSAKYCLPPSATTNMSPVDTHMRDDTTTAMADMNATMTDEDMSGANSNDMSAANGNDMSATSSADQTSDDGCNVSSAHTAGLWLLCLLVFTRSKR